MEELSALYASSTCERTGTDFTLAALSSREAKEDSLLGQAQALATTSIMSKSLTKLHAGSLMPLRMPSALPVQHIARKRPKRRPSEHGVQLPGPKT